MEQERALCVEHVLCVVKDVLSVLNMFRVLPSCLVCSHLIAVFVSLVLAHFGFFRRSPLPVQSNVNFVQTSPLAQSLPTSSSPSFMLDSTGTEPCEIKRMGDGSPSHIRIPYFPY